MKNFLYLFATLFIISCGNADEPIQCDNSALFSREEATGSMYYIPCYDSWSIHMDEPAPDDGRMNAASQDIPSQYQIDGLRVKFEACFYEFDMPLIIPDPTPIGLLYVIKDFSIVEE